MRETLNPDGMISKPPHNFATSPFPSCRWQSSIMKPSFNRHHWNVVPILGKFLFLLSLPLAAAPTEITSFVVGPTTVTLTFQNDGSSNQFTLQKNLGLDLPNWSNAGNAVLTPLGAGVYTFVVPRTAADKQFYRILSTLVVGTALDPDGDGLVADHEAILGTNPTLFDTDGDGFSDGVEFAADTDPLDPLSRPNFGLPPIVQFSASVVEANEGQPYQVQLILDRPFAGTISYEVNVRSTATAPSDYALLGSVTVSGTTATIPIVWVDDLEVQPERLLFLQLTSPADKSYQPGGRDFITIRVVDNDAWWSGLLAGNPDDVSNGTSYTQRSFRLKLATNGSTKTAVFAAGAGNDGLLIPVGESAGTAGSQSEGVIPPGVWTGTVTQNDSLRFDVASPAIPLPMMPSDTTIENGGSLFGCVSDLTRSLRLESFPNSVSPNAVPWSEIKALSITGRWTENVSSSAAPYMNRAATGFFVLVRDIPTLEPVPPPVPVP
jgi:hypothetical protein